MDITYLAIENDVAVYERESNFWQSRGVGSVRVTSMAEGIVLASKMRFLYISINASNVPYKTSLGILRDVTETPIFMASNQYTMKEQTEATKLGADLFGPLSETPEDNYEAVMAHIQHMNSRIKNRIPNTTPTVYRNILISESHRTVLVDDKEISLTKNEFDLLNSMASNRGIVYTFEKLANIVWKVEYDTYDTLLIETIKNTVARVRKKISDNDEKYCIIESIRGVGFKCPRYN